MDNNSTTTKSVALTTLIKEFNLDIIYAPQGLESVMITKAEINRPGLPLAGFFDYFDPERLHIIGRVEAIYLAKCSPEERRQKLYNFMERKPVCIITARNIGPYPEMIEFAEKFGIPLLKTSVTTNSFISSVIASLKVHLAPTITRHGVLVEVYGEGILITGNSGIGKSETAIELIKRGHRLIADDAVEISKVSEKTLVGRAPEIIRYYMELRGIGIIDIRRIFGAGSVKETEKIEHVINFEPWIEGKVYDRLGLETEYIDILGIKVPYINIPVRPGRNMAVIMEIAAMNSRLKKMGYNTAEEFNKRLEEIYKAK